MELATNNSIYVAMDVGGHDGCKNDNDGSSNRGDSDDKTQLRAVGSFDQPNRVIGSLGKPHRQSPQASHIGRPHGQ